MLTPAVKTMELHILSPTSCVSETYLLSPLFEILICIERVPLCIHFVGKDVLAHVSKVLPFVKLKLEYFVTAVYV